MSNMDGCLQCGRMHVTNRGTLVKGSCAGHTPCRRVPLSGSRFCSECGVTQGQVRADVLGTGLVPASTPVSNPLERLAALAGKLEAWLDLVEKQLAKVQSMADSEGRLTPELRAFSLLASRLGYLLAVMSRLDLDERLAKLDRVHADRFRELVDAVMAAPELELTPEQRQLWPVLFAAEVRRRVGGGPAELEGEVVDDEV